MIAATPPSRRLPRGAPGIAIALAVAVVVIATGVAGAGALSAAYPVKAVAGFVLASAVMWHLSPPLATLVGRDAGYGIANTITHTRLGVTTMLGAMLGEAAASSFAGPIVAVAVLTTAADGIDGAIARARGEQSAFGARFDMEVDALLILVLCALAWQLDKAGAWVLAAGLMRYLFVLGARRWPWLLHPLPPSLRRKVVCVLQILALITCLLPAVPRPASSMIAAAGVVLLAISFVIDIRWLHHTRLAPPLRDAAAEPVS